MVGSFLKQSTASQSRAIGPFIDDTDFKTAETGLTIANTDIKLVANGGTSANKNSGGGTHRVNGVYGVTFDATDTATVGELEVSVVVSGALPVFHKFWVLEEAVYDMLFGASALGYIANAPVNVAQISGDSTAADNMEADYDGTGYNKSNSTIGTCTTNTDMRGTDSAATASALSAAQTDITAILADTNELQTNQGNWLTATGFSTHSAADVWAVATRVLTANTNLNDPTAAQIADAVLDEALSGHVTAGTLGKAIADIETDTNELQTDDIPGTLATLATASALAMVDSNVDAILVDTDTTIPALITALNNISAADVWAAATRTLTANTNLNDITVADILTTAMTEAYPAQGGTATLAQALYTIMQHLGESSIASTTKTVKKRDGSTTAKTYTLDSDTSPTSITEAT